MSDEASQNSLRRHIDKGLKKHHNFMKELEESPAKEKKEHMAKKMGRKDKVGTRKSDYSSDQKQGNWMKVHKLDK